MAQFFGRAHVTKRNRFAVIRNTANHFGLHFLPAARLRIDLARGGEVLLHSPVADSDA